MKRDLEEYCNIIGKRLASIRKQKGFNQKQISDALREKGVILSTSSISKIENRTRKVSDIEVLVLSEVLNVSVDYLLNDENAEI